MIAKNTNRSTGNTNAKLVAQIKEVLEDLPRDRLRNAYARFRNRLEDLAEVRVTTLNKLFAPCHSPADIFYCLKMFSFLNRILCFPFLLSEC